MEEIWMITPEPCCSIDGRNPRSSRTAENRLRLNVRCQSSSVSARAPPLGADEPQWKASSTSRGSDASRLSNSLIEIAPSSGACWNRAESSRASRRAAWEQHQSREGSTPATRRSSAFRAVGLKKCFPLMLHKSAHSTRVGRAKESRYFDFLRRPRFSAIRAFTSLRTRATGRGLSA